MGCQVSNESETNTWLATAVEGGLPQILAGAAGKAISRLIGAGVDIPAAYLDQIAQGIRDKTDARTALSQAIAEHVKTQAVGDPDVMERAMNSMLSRSYRAQVNKDSVAKAAIEDLSETPPKEDNGGVSDVWMDKFERHAEEAGSVDLQLLFGKILAGEIREPGTISPATLHLVSMLDAQTASLIDKVLPYTLSTGVTLLAALPEKLSATEISFIEQSGFFSGDKRYSLTLNEDGRAGTKLTDEEFLIFSGNRNAKIDMGEAGVLSFAGKGLLQALKPKFNAAAYRELALKSPQIKSIAFGQGVENGGSFSLPVAETASNPHFVEQG